MDLDYETFVHSSGCASTALDDVVIGTDLKDIVDSICKEFPESPPDSGSEHLMSPGSGSGFVSGYTNLGANINESYSAVSQYNSSTIMPDLSKINYTLPMQMIESPDNDYKVLRKKNKFELFINLFLLSKSSMSKELQCSTGKSMSLSQSEGEVQTQTLT